MMKEIDLRITIEPTAEGLIEDISASNKVMIETSSDNLDAEEALDAVKRLLLAWGYHWENIYGNE